MRNVLVATFIAALLCGSYAFAQTDASVSGTVTDPSGAHVVNATITATNVATGVKNVVTTNEAGIYGFAALQPGKYIFTAEHGGFRKSTINDVTLEVPFVDAEILHGLHPETDAQGLGDGVAHDRRS